jgi:RimJ/RimL family protein N-acetyltransferase
MTTVLETDRLILRRISVDDAEFILELLNDPSFLANVGDRGARTVADARAYIRKGPLVHYERHGFGLYLVVRKDDRVSLGICGLVKRDVLPDPDVGFAFLPRFWSKGYAFESASAVVAYGRSTLGLTRIVAVTKADNDASIRVLGKLGLRFDRMVRLSEGAPEIQLFAPGPPVHPRRPSGL